MKKILSLVLALLLVASLFPWGTVANAETIGKEGFYMVNWNGSAVDFVDYDYAYAMPWFYTSKAYVKPNSESISVSVGMYNSSDPATIAQRMKEDFNNRPDGARYLNLNTMTDTFKGATVDLVDMSNGVRLVKGWLTNFLEIYSSIGGKLDGIAVDLEYNAAYAFYVQDDEYADYAKNNRQIYNQIVANAEYQKRIRPKLVARGFEFYVNPNPTKYPDRSEIWTMYRYDSSGGKAACRSIWDAVINEVLAEYINEAVLEPLLAYYPKATLSDYHRGDTDSWLKGVNDNGAVVGKQVKAGNTSNYNLYDFRPASNFYKYTTDKTTGLKKRTVYIAPPSFNDAVYEDTAFSGALWDVNLHKRLLNSTDTGLINSWLAFANYGKRYSMTPYYAEAVYHVGLLNPKPFLGYIIRSEVENKGDNHPHIDAGDYYCMLQVVDELMAELTRVAGTTDRKPIVMPINWNGSYMLTGMYAGGRNIWRITPDTTKVSAENFKVKDTAPTFQVDGLTITFPQGRIISDSKISMVGTCGYWVETPANVTPVVTSSADRYENNPAFAESFETYKTGAFTSASAYPHTYWTVTGNAEIKKNGNAQVLALSGNATLENTMVPQNITAGDGYAKQQAWEVTVTLPSGNYGEVKLLAAGDGGLKISGGKVYYDKAGTYQELAGVTLSAGTYTIRREVDFRTTNGYKSSYSVYDASGKRIGGADQVATVAMTLPVSAISISTTGAASAVLIDDYKLYPTGATTILELYETKYGKKITDTAAARTEETAYRLSWMNASGQYKVARVYDVKSGKILKKVDMAPGMDGVITGIVDVEAGKSIQIALDVKDETAPNMPNYDNGNFRWTAASESLGLATGPKPAGGDTGNTENPGGDTGTVTPENPGGDTGNVTPENPGAGEEGGNIYEDGIIDDTPETEPAVTEPAGNTNSESTIGGADAPDNVEVQEKTNNKTLWVILAISLAVAVIGAIVFVFVIKPKKAAKDVAEKPQE